MPLFGLHNILAAFKPDAEESKIRIAIEVYSALSISFQACMYCILQDGERKLRGAGDKFGDYL